MAKDRSERKEKKEKKEKRRSDVDGVKKSKKDKKRESLVNGDAEEDLTAKVLESLDKAPAADDQMDIDSEVKARPVGALVPFANPLADEKVTKKVLKSVKKCMSIVLFPENLKCSRLYASKSLISLQLR